MPPISRKQSHSSYLSDPSWICFQRRIGALGAGVPTVVVTGDLEPGGDTDVGKDVGNSGGIRGGGWRRARRLRRKEYCGDLIH